MSILAHICCYEDKGALKWAKMGPKIDEFCKNSSKTNSVHWGPVAKPKFLKNLVNLGQKTLMGEDRPSLYRNPKSRLKILILRQNCSDFLWKKLTITNLHPLYVLKMAFQWPPVGKIKSFKSCKSNLSFLIWSMLSEILLIFRFLDLC